MIQPFLLSSRARSSPGSWIPGVSFYVADTSFPPGLIIIDDRSPNNFNGMSPPNLLTANGCGGGLNCNWDLGIDFVSLEGDAVVRSVDEAMEQLRIWRVISDCIYRE